MRKIRKGWVQVATIVYAAEVDKAKRALKDAHVSFLMVNEKTRDFGGRMWKKVYVSRSQARDAVLALSSHINSAYLNLKYY